MQRIVNYPSTGGHTNINTGSGSLNSIGATFKNNGTYVIDSVRAYLSKSGSPTGTVYAVLYAITGTPGSSAVPTGTPLASSDTINASGLTTTPTLTTLSFTGTQRYAMTNNTSYAMAIFCSGGNASNQIIIGDGDGVSGQNYVTLIGGSGWSAGTSLMPALDIYGAYDTAPTTDFAANTTLLNLGDPVDFTDESTLEPLSWSWDFGDGDTSTSQNPSHTYSAAGTYTVGLTATNDGGSDSVTKTDYVTVVTPSKVSGVAQMSGISSITL